MSARTLPAALASSLPRRVPRPVPYRKAAVPNGRALSSGANPASHDTAAAVTSSLTSASPRSGRRNTADPPTTSGATSGAGVASPARDSPSPRPSSSSRIPRPALHAPARPTRPSVRPTDLPGRPLDAPRAHGAPTSAPPSSSSLLVDAPVAPTRFYGSSSGALGSRSRGALKLSARELSELTVACRCTQPACWQVRRLARGSQLVVFAEACSWPQNPRTATKVNAGSACARRSCQLSGCCSRRLSGCRNTQTRSTCQRVDRCFDSCNHKSCPVAHRDSQNGTEARPSRCTRRS
jgi:hypothetical protein